MLHYAAAHRSTRHTSISLETSPSWQKTSQMQTDSLKKYVLQPHRLVTAGIDVIVLAVEKSTDTTTTTAMEKRGNHKQTVNIEVSSNDVVEFLPDLTTFHAGNLREFVPSWRWLA